MKKDTIEVVLTTYGELQVVGIPVKLYKDSYKVVKLRCLAPKQNGDVLLKVYGTDVDESGETIITTQAYSLSYKKQTTINKETYFVYENFVPREFCEKEGDITLNFTQVVIGEEETAEKIITSGTLNLFIYGEGFNANGVKISKYDEVSARLNALSTGLIETMGLRPYSSTFEYSLGTLTFAEVDGKISLFKSLVDNNLGNPVTSLNYWQPIVISGVDEDKVVLKEDFDEFVLRVNRDLQETATKTELEELKSDTEEQLSERITKSEFQEETSKLTPLSIFLDERERVNEALANVKSIYIQRWED